MRVSVVGRTLLKAPPVKGDSFNSELYRGGQRPCGVWFFSVLSRVCSSSLDDHMIIAARCLLFIVLEQFVIVALLIAGVILNYSLTSHRLYSALFSSPPLATPQGTIPATFFDN